MANLQTDEVKAIQQTLEAEKAKILERIAQLKTQDPFSDPERLTDNAASDQEASEESNHDRFAALIQELTDQLAAIDGALARIADGSYGTCTSCGSPIEPARLAVIPTASVCMKCETSA